MGSTNSKRSIWANIILIVSIVSAALLVLAIVFFALGLAGVRTAAEQAAAEQGLSGDQVTLAVNIAIITTIVVFVIANILNVLEIVGGFLFALKGKWGLFCIVMAILSLIGTGFNFFSGFGSGVALNTMILNGLELALGILFLVACFKHRAELQD
ncbi:MAG: hypothetical protein K6F32_07260 [Bacilli bacterium]|nr:hypothetical protein [Bacilli bacterium]